MTRLFCRLMLSLFVIRLEWIFHFPILISSALNWISITRWMLTCVCPLFASFLLWFSALIDYGKSGNKKLTSHIFSFWLLTDLLPPIYCLSSFVNCLDWIHDLAPLKIKPLHDCLMCCPWVKSFLECRVLISGKYILAFEISLKSINHSRKKNCLPKMLCTISEHYCFSPALISFLYYVYMCIEPILHSLTLWLTILAASPFMYNFLHLYHTHNIFVKHWMNCWSSIKFDFHCSGKILVEIKTFD